MQQEALIQHEHYSPDEVFEKYRRAYCSNVQGCCLLIADEIIQHNGGEAVAGELTWYGGSCRRSHWWVEIEGKCVDPMGDPFLAEEVAPGRREHHRDRTIFESLLQKYEQ